MKNMFLRIEVSDTGSAFSGIKCFTPKMVNAMKELCVTYEKTFGCKFVVRRYISTNRGLVKAR